MEDLAFELKRKLVHIASLIFVVMYYFINLYFSQRAALLSLLLVLIILSFLEFLQMRYSRKIPIFHHLYRENEKNTFSGSIYLLIGMIIAFAIFDFNIALVAVLMMIFGDSASSIIGRLGKHRIDGIKVSWEGIIAEFLIDLIIGLIFLNNILLIFVMALVATITETLLSSIDDNLAVPIVAGFAGQAMVIILKIFNLY